MRHRRAGDARRRDPAARLALEADLGELVEVGREVRRGGVDLLEQRLGREVDDELAGRLAFASESLRPIDVNCTIGGSAQETVKNECGARLSTPAAERVETQAIGRGTTTELSSR